MFTVRNGASGSTLQSNKSSRNIIEFFSFLLPLGWILFRFAFDGFFLIHALYTLSWLASGRWMVRRLRWTMLDGTERMLLFE